MTQYTFILPQHSSGKIWILGINKKDTTCYKANGTYIISKLKCRASMFNEYYHQIAIFFDHFHIVIIALKAQITHMATQKLYPPTIGLEFSSKTKE